MKVAVFDGRITSRIKKKAILNDFYDVLILQIQTGCEGLNLQEKYSEIYFVSPHWNPAVEEQAIARCHRIGQTKSVFVKRFVMGDFVENMTNVIVDEHGNVCNENRINVVTMDEYITQVQDVKKKIISTLTNE
jgi:DNA repair protein RAD5